jgi:hypothetical protein
MKLIHLPTNNKWAFTFGDALVRVGDYEMFFTYRHQAVEAANAVGLAVDENGNVINPNATN